MQVTLKDVTLKNETGDEFVFGFPVAPPTEFTEAEIEDSLREAVRLIQNNYRYAMKRGWLQETRKTFPSTLRQLVNSLESEG